jgi:anti-sigma factor RsiW
MSPSLCPLIDAYLDGELPQGRRDDFLRHLETCPSCQAEASAQRRLDELFSTPAIDPPAVPPELIDRIQRHVRSRVRRRLLNWSLGIAATVLIAAAWLIDDSGPARREEAVVRSSQDRASQALDHGESPSPQRDESPLEVGKPQVAVSVDPRQYLAVPVTTSNPNVTILWLYPTTKPVPAEPSSGNRQT